MRVTIIGSGYVGLVTGACLAETGNIVMCMDKDVERINLLKAGKIPFHEPGLAPLVERNLSDGRLIFTTDLRSAVRHAPVIFLAVGTPPRPNGEADLSAVEETARAIGAHLDGPAVIVTKSTVPVGTAGRVKTLISDKTSHPFAVIANPEFLKEGAAVHDFMSPDRVILGGDDAEAIALLRVLYGPFMRREDRILVMDAASAELTKYASNAMLATRISFMNEIAALCERVGANAEHVRHGLGADSRIGSSFLFPATDPVALERARELFGTRVVLDRDSYRILEGADGLLLVTEWNEYRFPDFERIRDLLRKPTLFDGRNIWNRRLVEGLGFTYYGIGV